MYPFWVACLQYFVGQAVQALHNNVHCQPILVVLKIPPVYIEGSALSTAGAIASDQVERSSRNILVFAGSFDNHLIGMVGKFRYLIANVSGDVWVLGDLRSKKRF